MTLVLPSSPQTYSEGFFQGAAATEGLFGGNLLASRGILTGPGSYDEAINGLGITGLRYPGGSLTEEYFDITNPDATTATSHFTGETTDFIPISEFLAYAKANGQEATIVVPTYSQLGEADENGDRLSNIHEANLREFVHDVATGVYGEAPIGAIEIGNEYWGSGLMNAVEYGRLSSEMALIIDDELQAVTEEYGIQTDQIGVLVQAGFNFGTSQISDEYVGWDSHDVIDDLVAKHPTAVLSYDNIRANGNVNWGVVNNELILMSYDTPEKMAAVDGVLGHIYTHGIESDDNGTFQLDTMRNSWLEKDGFEDLRIHITEWNQKSTKGLDRDEDYGLFQAHEMLEILESFMAAEVKQAFVWPLIQNTSNTLSTGKEYSGPTAPGEMFSMMSENLPGKVAIDFTPGGVRDTEYEGSTVDVHAFAGQGDMVFYIASTASEAAVTDIDLSNLVAGYDAMDIRVLGVMPGESPGNTRSDVDVQQLNADDIFQDGILEVDLDEGEIMQVVIQGIQPTESFAPTLDAIDAAELGDEPVIVGDELPVISIDELVVPVEEAEDIDDQADGGLGDLAFLIGLLPILALFGLAA
tara:strand:+ start:359 stop:2107 length:1749 start_codon:yes stop_codon:yes gene_type:complete